MNLNFYDPSNNNYLNSLQNTLNDSLNKLEQIRNVSNTPKESIAPSEQRYYLDCGQREEWNEFLKLNYNLTEREIFNDYKLFLQAKAELYEDDNKEKLQAMKDKLSNTPKLSQKSSRAINEYNNGTNIAENSNNNTTTTNNAKYERNKVRNENKGDKHVR